MKCPCCKKEIPDNARFCPKCGREISSMKADKSVKKDSLEKWMQLLIILVVMMLGVILAIILIWNRKNNREEKEPEFTAYYEPVNREAIRYNGKVKYVDSHLLLTAAQDASFSEIESLAGSYDAEIIGYISLTNDYQINFSDGKSYEELEIIIEEFQKNPLITFATLEFVQECTVNSVDYTTDPWISAADPDDTGSVWSTVPDGANWWAEAILMPQVWEADYEFEEVKVGLLDSYFDNTNEDLTYAFAEDGIIGQDGINVAELYKQAVKDEKEKKEPLISSNALSHGTAVSGIIAAKNNGFGICGVSQNAVLYGVSLYGNSEGWNTSTMAWKYGISELLNKGVKVINISMGYSTLIFAAQQEDTNADTRTTAALDELEMYSNSMEVFLERCLEQYDFLVVKSVGNNGGYYYNKVDINEDNPYGYEDVSLRNRRKPGAINKYCDAKYDVLGAISNENVQDHIIMVGSIDMNITHSENARLREAYSYQISSFSNRGKRVDIYAPGGWLVHNKKTGILCDLPDNKTEYAHGTSFAAPMVSGTAALIWGINPELTAPEVKNLILTTATKAGNIIPSTLNPNYMENKLEILNVYNAIMNAEDPDIHSFSGHSDSAIFLGFAYNMVIDENGNESKETLDADFSLYNSDKSMLMNKLELDKSLEFCTVLEAGDYILKVTCEGFGDYEEEIHLEENETFFCAVKLSPKDYAPIYEVKTTDYGNEDIYRKFVEEEGYDDDLLDIGESEEVRYAIFDIDADGVKECIIEAKIVSHDYGVSKTYDYYYIFYRYDMNEEKIVKSGLVRNWEEGLYYTRELNMLSCYTRTSSDHTDHMYSYNGESVTWQYDAGWWDDKSSVQYIRYYYVYSMDNVIGSWIYGDEDGAEEAEAEYQKYTGNLIRIEFRNVSSLVEGSGADEENMISEDAEVFNGHNYKFYHMDSIDSWEEAEAYCENMGGHLATITSEEEQNFICNYIKKFKMDVDIWIGITDVKAEGDWSHWITGEDVTYTNWGEAEPDNRGGGQHYGVICSGYRSGSGFNIEFGQWDDIDNEKNSIDNCFICEWDLSLESI